MVSKGFHFLSESGSALWDLAFDFCSLAAPWTLRGPLVMPPLLQEPPKISQVTTDKFLVLSKIKLFPLVNFHQMSSLIWKQDVAHEKSEVRVPVHLHWLGAERKGWVGEKWDRRMAFRDPKSFMEWAENQWIFKSETQNSESFFSLLELKGHRLPMLEAPEVLCLSSTGVCPPGSTQKPSFHQRDSPAASASPSEAGRSSTLDGRLTYFPGLN